MSSKTLKILLVDDNPADVMLMKEAIRKSSISVSLFELGNGQDAIKYLRRLPPYETATTPDLVLLDLQLPLKSGKEVLREVKSDVLLSSIPIIIMSTSSSCEDILQSYQLHAASYVVKPAEWVAYLRIISLLHAYWSDVATLPARNS